MKVIIGLGNPGKEYANTRHNIGFMVIDHLANSLDIMQFKEKFKAEVAEGRIGKEKILLVKPLTYMNLSGEAVIDIVRFFKAEPEDIIVIYDDMDLDLGSLRIRKKGSAGGHNGMKSIIYQLQSDNFTRLRVGVGKPQHDAVHHVLGNFNDQETLVVNEAIKRAAKAVEIVINEGTDKAMNLFNEKRTGTVQTE